MIKYRLRGKSVEQLVDLAQSGLKDALEMIIEKYYPMVLKISSKYYAPWAEKDDIVQNGLVGLIKAVFYYNKEKSGFTSFAWRSIEAEIQSFLTYLNRKKNKILSEAMSVDAFAEDGEGESSYFLSDYELTTSRKAIVEYLIEEVMKFLNEEEKEIFSMWLNGYSYKDISENVGVSPKKVDNTVQKVKRILKDRGKSSIFNLLKELI